MLIPGGHGLETQTCTRDSRLFSSSWLSTSSSCGCMLLMDWKSESTALSLVMLRPRMWLLFMRLRKVVTAFCKDFRNCSWFSSDSPFWYCCWRDRCKTFSAEHYETIFLIIHFQCPRYLHYVDGLDRSMAFHWLADWHRLSQWNWSRSRGGGTLANLFLFLLPVSSV